MGCPPLRMTVLTKRLQRRTAGFLSLELAAKMPPQSYKRMAVRRYYHFLEQTLLYAQSCIIAL